MNHHQGVPGHDHRISRHGDDRCDRAGKAVYPHGFVGRMPPELVVNCGPLKYRAAPGIDVNYNLLHIRVLAQLFPEFLGRIFAFGVGESAPVEMFRLYIPVDIQFQGPRGLGLLDFPHRLHVLLLPRLQRTSRLVNVGDVFCQ